MNLGSTILNVTSLICLISLQAAAIDTLNAKNQSPALLPKASAAALLVDSSESIPSLKAKKSASNPKPKSTTLNELQKSNSEISLKQIFENSKAGLYNQRPKMGGMDGGGGKTLICKSGNQYSIQVLDLYEGEAAGLRINTGSGKNLQEKIDFVLKRLARIAPQRAGAYAKWIKGWFEGDAAYYKDVILPVTDDVGLVVLPNNCQLLQVIVQRKSADADIPGLARYLVDKDIFNLLDDDSKIALIFHEIIYRELRAEGATTSERTRYLNYLILSDQINNLDRDRFNNIIGKIGSKCFESAIASALYNCGSLPESFSKQSLNWGAYQFQGLLSVAANSGDNYLGIKSKADSIRFSDILKDSIYNSKTGIDLEIQRGDHDDITVYFINSIKAFSTSGVYPIEFKNGLYVLKGECMLAAGLFSDSNQANKTFDEIPVMYCKSAVQILTDGTMYKLVTSKNDAYNSDPKNVRIWVTPTGELKGNFERIKIQD